MMESSHQEGCAIKHRIYATSVVLCLLLTLVAVTACSRSQAPSGPGRVLPTSTPLPTPLPPLPTLPPPGSSQNPLVVLLVNAGGDVTQADAEALGEALAEETDLFVEARLVNSHAEARAALCAGTAHVVSLNAFAYLSASQQECGEALYVAEVDGETTTQGQMITGSGRSVFSLEGFRGYRFCRPAADSVAGWIVPGLALQANGVNPLRDLFSVTDSGSDQRVVEMIINFQCDVGATVVGAEVGLPNSNRIIVVEVLPEVPNDVIALSSRLDTDTRSAMRDALSRHLDDIALLMGVESLEDATDGIFDDLRALAEEAGVDIAAMGE